ncbi:hypothetical protein J7L68_05950 [bacterium]|nr:hypothetical protein [bacterium]
MSIKLTQLTTRRKLWEKESIILSTTLSTRIVASPMPMTNGRARCGNCPTHCGRVTTMCLRSPNGMPLLLRTLTKWNTILWHFLDPPRGGFFLLV